MAILMAGETMDHMMPRKEPLYLILTSAETR